MQSIKIELNKNEIKMKNKLYNFFTVVIILSAYCCLGEGNKSFMNKNGSNQTNSNNNSSLNEIYEDEQKCEELVTFQSPYNMQNNNIRLSNFIPKNSLLSKKIISKAIHGIDIGEFYNLEKLVNTNDLLGLDETDQALILNYAIKKGSYTSFVKLIQFGINPNVVDNEDLAPIHSAVKFKELGILKKLLECDIFLEVREPENNYTPLEIAIFANDQITAFDLLEYGVNVNPLSLSGKTLLDRIYSSRKYENIYHFLRNYGSAHRQLVLKELIDTNPSCNSNNIKYTGISNEFICMFKDYYNDFEDHEYLMWLFLQHLNINLRNVDHTLFGSWLHWSSRNSYASCVSLLLIKGLNPLEKFDGRTPLDLVGDDNSNEQKFIKRNLLKHMELRKNAIRLNKEINQNKNNKSVKHYLQEKFNKVHSFFNNLIFNDSTYDGDDQLLNDYEEEPLYNCINTLEYPEYENQNLQKEDTLDVFINPIETAVISANVKNCRKFTEELNKKYRKRVEFLLKNNCTEGIELDQAKIIEDINRNIQPGAVDNCNFVCKDIIKIILDFLPHVVNLENSNNFTPLDISPAICMSPIYYDLLSQGAFHSKSKIEEIILKRYNKRPNQIDNRLIKKLATRGDIDSVAMLLGHPNIGKNELFINDVEGGSITDFRFPMKVANELVQRLSKNILKPGFNMSGYCNNRDCVKYKERQWMNFKYKGKILDDIEQLKPIEYDYEEDGVGGAMLIYSFCRRKCSHCKKRLEKKHDNHVTVVLKDCKYVCAGDLKNSSTQYIVNGATSSKKPYFAFNFNNMGALERLQYEIRTSAK